MAVVAEAYEAPTTIRKAMLPLLKKLVLLGGFEVMFHRSTRRGPDRRQCHSSTGSSAIDSDLWHINEPLARCSYECTRQKPSCGCLSRRKNDAKNSRTN